VKVHRSGATARRRTKSASVDADIADRPKVDQPSFAEVVDEETLHAAITRALLNGRLRPGTALRERYLAEEFSVTRGLVRKVLLRLGQEGKLEMHANRGAFVPEPSVEQIRSVYEARKAVEAGVVSLLAASITTQQLAQIKKHLRNERAASRRARRDESVQLAGDFHLVLAQLLGNPVLLEIVERLVGRTQMFVALFESPQFSDCAANEHEPVVEALTRRSPADAAEAMVKHLSLVEQRVLASAQVKEDAPLATILRSALQGH
jgi:DNA-binding GntR family transcriptional regulator